MICLSAIIPIYTGMCNSYKTIRVMICINVYVAVQCGRIMNQQIFSFFQRLKYIIVSPITGVVEHADFRETEGGGGSKLGGLGGRILGAPLKLLSTDTFKSAASGNAGFFLPSHVKAPWKQSK